MADAGEAGAGGLWKKAPIHFGRALDTSGVGHPGPSVGRSY
jgi:hypothetical protein